MPDLKKSFRFVFVHWYSDSNSLTFFLREASNMAATHATTSSILSSFLPRLTPSTVSVASRSTTLYSRRLSHPLLPRLAVSIPSAIQLNIPGILEGIWEGILKAVPKKKTSHMKKRHRQMAGKGLKDVTSLNRCSACGEVKRAHLLCPYCVSKIKSMFRRDERVQRQEVEAAAKAERMAIADAKAAEDAERVHAANVVADSQGKDVTEGSLGNQTVGTGAEKPVA